MFKQITQNIHQRTNKAYFNIFRLFITRGVGIGISFLLVPVALNYLDSTKYGIWVTITAIFSWFSLFDIGIGNGLRNRLTEAIALKDFKMARVYISTTYATVFIIFSSLYIVFLIANLFIDWTSILNTNGSFKSELRLLAEIVFFFFCMRFVVQIISTIALANQDPALSQIIDVFGRLIALLVIYLVTFFTQDSIVLLGLTLTSIPVIVSILFSIYLFRSKYYFLRPRLKYIQFRQLKNILNIGIKFFLIQITGIVFYQTNNIIISQIFGPEKVTDFSITFQYLNIIPVIFYLIVTPYWSAFTDAYVKNELDWIKNEVHKLKVVWLSIIIGFVILLYLANTIIPFWIGKDFNFSYHLSLTIIIYLMLSSYSSINCSLLNGVGKIKLQWVLAVAFAFIHIPISLFFAKRYGMPGLMYSAILNTAITTIVYEIQYRKIVSNKAYGIWNK